jgi:hypothetical protein
MARRRADIQSPDVVLRFRHRFVEFDEIAQQALASSTNDVRSLTDWLRGDQLRHWKTELRRRHDEMKTAWREYVDARHGDPRVGKQSSVDERKAWERAKRRKVEAEEKIQRIKGWATALEREAERLRAPCLRFDEILITLVPKALNRLDRILDDLDEYLKRTPPKAGS